MNAEGSVILCADDFALTAAASDGILALADAGRLSATGAIVTAARWPADAVRLVRLRDRLALGLHLNLTEGRPLGPMPHLAPAGDFSPIGPTIRQALAGRIDRREVREEVLRQLDRFESETGFLPDFLDGHHHVHALPGIRDAVLDALTQRRLAGSIFLRDPSDHPMSALRRGVAARKALTVATLAAGFRGLAARSGFSVNRGFSGFSTFGAVPYADEFPAFLRYAGRGHLIMCHPGLADAGAETGDPIARRRFEEYEVLSSRADLPRTIWRPQRKPAEAGLQWP